MPVIGLGTWKLTNNTSDVVSYALEIGYRMIDTSSDYGTQPGIGKAIRKSSIDRKDIYLVTKVEETDDAYKATKKYLKQMDQEYADLILIHRPPSIGIGRDLWKGLMRTKQERLTNDIGVSNYTIDLLDQLMQETDEVPAVNQIEWSPFGYDNEMKEYCDEKKIIIQSYSPLTRTKKLDNETLNQIADKYNKTPAQIIIRWNLQIGTVPLPKANQKQHLKENLDVFDFEIDNDEMKQLNNLNKEYSSLKK